jgi:dTDP-4-amino-4,6-dideoxygalactose transaminase
MIRVPLFDLRAEHARLGSELISAVSRVLESGRVVLGPEVDAFEDAVRARLGVRYAVGVSSGSDALLAALMALGVGPGDEVVTSSFTFIATVEAILRLGATPCFVDVEPGTLDLDPRRVDAAVNTKTRAIIVVHVYGRPARVDVLSEIASRHAVPLVEDAAQAFGSRYLDRPLGRWGRCGCFSFFPTKVLGAAGDAGMFVTDDEALGEKVRRLRQHGAERKACYVDIGGNFRMDALQAAILSVKLSHLDRSIALRLDHARAYDEVLSGISGVSAIGARSEGSWNGAVYSIRVAAGRRDALRAHLWERSVETGVYYDPPAHMQPVLEGRASRAGALPETERAAGEVLSLPLYPELRVEQRDWVIESVYRFFRG